MSFHGSMLVLMYMQVFAVQTLAVVKSTANMDISEL